MLNPLNNPKNSKEIDNNQIEEKDSIVIYQWEEIK